ncbi:hypothetical protein M422DRAFT_777801 [Sphaerobolus stellatus SS14]|nr:hypothetical protein M422DRAFT_777801 [Sphaerobolus stellatus SS14]
MSSKAFTRTTIKIPAINTPNWKLDTWKYIPTGPNAGSKPLPVIIMAHGLSGNKLLKLAPYAEAFATAGYAVLVFDYRRWGDSDGLPRHILHINEQLDDYRSVVKFARQQPEFDAQKVVLWGTSLSGGYAVNLASDGTISPAAIIGQCTWTGKSTPPAVNLALFLTLLLAIVDYFVQLVGLKPILIKAGAAPGKIGNVSLPGTKEGMESLQDRPGDLPNEINASSAFELMSYFPHKMARNISCPALLLNGDADPVCTMEGANIVAACGPKTELVVVPGDHFAMYPGHPQFDAAIKAKLEFLKKYVA